LERAKEPSTWTGLVTLVPALATHQSVITTVAATVASVVLVLVKEARPITTAVIVQDAEPIVADAVTEAVNKAVG
jgi:hypothetical protein